MNEETIKSVTKGDINDLKAYANAIGVKCENCEYAVQGKLSKMRWCESLEISIYNKESHFCSNFEKKETNEKN